jgi:hypothetical protein
VESLAQAHDAHAQMFDLCEFLGDRERLHRYMASGEPQPHSLKMHHPQAFQLLAGTGDDRQSDALKALCPEAFLIRCGRRSKVNLSSSLCWYTHADSMPPKPCQCDKGVIVRVSCFSCCSKSPVEARAAVSKGRYRRR